MAKGKKNTTLWVVLAAGILAIFALGKLGGSEPDTTARQTTAAVTETTVQTTAGTTAKQTAGAAKAKTAAKKKQTAANVPAFSGKPYVVLDDNQPRFSAKDKKRRSAYESYAPLDSLGRAVGGPAGGAVGWPLPACARRLCPRKSGARLAKCGPAVGTR